MKKPILSTEHSDTNRVIPVNEFNHMESMLKYYEHYHDRMKRLIVLRMTHDLRGQPLNDEAVLIDELEER